MCVCVGSGMSRSFESQGAWFRDLARMFRVPRFAEPAQVRPKGLHPNHHSKPKALGSGCTPRYSPMAYGCLCLSTAITAISAARNEQHARKCTVRACALGFRFRVQRGCMYGVSRMSFMFLGIMQGINDLSSLSPSSVSLSPSKYCTR